MNDEANEKVTKTFLQESKAGFKITLRPSSYQIQSKTEIPYAII